MALMERNPFCLISYDRGRIFKICMKTQIPHVQFNYSSQSFRIKTISIFHSTFTNRSDFRKNAYNSQDVTVKDKFIIFCILFFPSFLRIVFLPHVHFFFIGRYRAKQCRNFRLGNHHCIKVTVLLYVYEP